MVLQVRSHDEYLTFVAVQTESLGLRNFVKDFYLDTVTWVSLMDLTPTVEILKNQYSTDPRGRKPRNPCDMLRSYLLMHKLQYTSIDKWVHALKTVPLFAVLSGFEPDSVPGVGTFYDFLNRLWLAPSPHLSKAKKKKVKKPRKKGKKNQKLKPKNPNIVRKLVDRALKDGKNHYSKKATDQLQILFQTMFVHKDRKSTR